MVYFSFIRRLQQPTKPKRTLDRGSVAAPFATACLHRACFRWHMLALLRLSLSPTLLLNSNGRLASSTSQTSHHFYRRYHTNHPLRVVAWKALLHRRPGTGRPQRLTSRFRGQSNSIKHQTSITCTLNIVGMLLCCFTGKTKRVEKESNFS